MRWHNYESRTDNLHLPNTEKGWAEFRWYLQSFGGKAIVAWFYHQNQETEYRKNAAKNNAGNQNNVQQDILDKS